MHSKHLQAFRFATNDEIQHDDRREEESVIPRGTKQILPPYGRQNDNKA
ncbi:hypothetical protein [Phocaeicola sp.]